MKRILWDISGAFGDIGIFFPIAIALIARNGFNPTALLLMAGLFYILSSRYFRITMPVQPLKAMSAIAIAAGLESVVINAAGIIMGVLLLLLAMSGLSVRLGRLFPLSVIRGIQLGLGLMLVKSSLSLLNNELSIALISGLVLFFCLFFLRSIPPLLPLLFLGFLLSILSIKDISLLTSGPVPVVLVMPSFEHFYKGFILLVLPQIALSFGNAIVATEATGKILYGERAERLTLKSIPMSMGIANIISGIAGAAPMCHGSGGLTAHRKFGASTERSGYIIGAFLLILALFFGRSALTLISAFPSGILGILLLYVGIQHGLFIKDIWSERNSLIIALIVALTGFIFNNLTTGFLAGIICHHGLIQLRRRIDSLNGQHS